MRDKDELIGFGEYLNILRHSLPAVVAFGVVGCVVAHVVTVFKTPVYESSTELVVELPKTGAVIRSEVRPYKAWDDTFLHTQIRVLQSDLLLGKAVDIVLEAEGPVATGGTQRVEARTDDGQESSASGWIDRVLGRRQRHKIALDQYIAQRPRDRLVSELSGGLAVSSVPRTRVLTLLVRSPSPAFAAAAANAIGAAYDDYISGTTASTAERTFLLLQDQATETRASIKKTAQQVLEFKKQSEVDVLTSDESSMASLDDAQKKLVKERLAGADSQIVALREERAQVEAEIEGLALRYLPKHPDMQALQRKRDLLDQRIETLTNHAWLQWLQDHLKERSRVEYSMLEQDLDASRRLHELVVGKMKEIDFTKDSPGMTVRVLRRAEAGGVPAYPKPAVNLVLGTACGLLVGLVLAFVRAFSRASLISLAVEEDTLPAPLVGRLPYIADEKALHALLTHEDASSPAAEAVRVLRTSLQAKSSSERNVILITSPDRGDGKSTVSIALARSFARLGRKTLLVDVDLRRGELHRIIGSQADGGLAELLKGDTTVVPTEIDANLAFLSRGHATENPSELLGSEAMDAFTRTVREEYEIVILDSPPLLPVTDASLLARHAQIRLMVVRSLKTHIEACHLAGTMLHNLGYEIDGVILNGIRATETSYSGYYHRYYYRGYGSGRDKP